MTSRPLLYLCVRPERDAAAGEFAAFRLAMGRDAELHEWDLVRHPLPASVFDDYAGFVVGGSPFNVIAIDKSATQQRLEADLERVAAAAAASGTSALFTCYGIGIVTRMLGGTVTADFAEDTSAATITLTEDGQSDAMFGVLPRTFAAYTAHKEGTLTVPSGAVLLATNETCPVQAYRYGSRLYATQFHPELTAISFTERMSVYRDAGYFDPTEFDIVAERVLAARVDAPAKILRAFAEALVPA